MKTFKELMEDVNSIVPAGTKPVGVDKDMTAYEMGHMEKFCQQISNAAQPEMPSLMAHIEAELNKFGRTLGELDNEVDMESEGDSEDLVIYTKSTGEMIENVYLALDWDRLATAVVVNYRLDGAKLINAVTLTLEKLAPGELRAMLGGMENNPLEQPALAKEPNPTEDGFSKHDA